jgi:hypothetical protein
MPTLAIYANKLRDYVRASGKLPVVAILGGTYYETLRTELLTLFNVNMPDAKEAPRGAQIMGVTVFKGGAEDCIHFGGPAE